MHHRRVLRVVPQDDRLEDRLEALPRRVVIEVDAQARLRAAAAAVAPRPDADVLERDRLPRELTRVVRVGLEVRLERSPVLRAVHVVLGRVADHRRRAGGDAQPVECGLEDRGVRLRLAVRRGAHRHIDVEDVVCDEGFEVATRVGDQPELEVVRPQLGEHGQRVLVELEVLGVLPGARHLDGTLVRALGLARAA